LAIFKEIITKAIIGKGRRSFKNTYHITTEIAPTTVLGCWVINHKFKGYETGNKITIDGSFEANIWYSYDNDSKTSVVSRKFDYSESVNVKVKEEPDYINDREIVVRALKQPTCTKIEIKDGEIELEIEKELGIEIVGDSKLKISVEEKEEPWELIEEDLVTEEVEKQIEENVNETVIKDSVKNS
jgi:spore coat protein E